MLVCIVKGAGVLFSERFFFFLSPRFFFLLFVLRGLGEGLVAAF